MGSRVYARLDGALLVSLISVLTPPVTATDLFAQDVRGTVVDRSSGLPVTGALIEGLDAGDRVLSRALTDQDGGFVLRGTDGRGVSHVTVVRIGYETDRMAVVPTDGHLRVEVSRAPIQLPGLGVVGDSHCDLGREGSSMAAALWAEAEKALLMSTVSQSEAASFEVERYRRELDPRGLRVLDGTTRLRSIVSDRPFVSVEAEVFEASGWVGEDAADLVYYAPDAAALLSPEFSEHHCFWAESAGDEYVLHFEPNRRRDVPEIAGAFFLDAETQQLGHLRFRYVNLQMPAEGQAVAGGEVRFTTAPNGRRVVSDWAIRMPVVEVNETTWRNRRTTPARVTRILEEGGRILSIQADGRTRTLRQDTHLDGVVQTGNAPLSNAHVSILGTTFSTTTGDDGSFAFSGIPSGRYVLSVAHPSLDSLLWLERWEEPVEIGEGARDSIQVVTPDAPEVAMIACQENGPWRAFLEQLDETVEVAVVFGRVFRGENDPAGDEVIRSSFSRWNVGVAAGRPGIPEGFERREMIAKSIPGLARVQRLTQGHLVAVTEDRWIIESRTDEEGRFVVCAPVGALIELEAPELEGSPIRSLRVLHALTRIDLGVPD
jgi:hypothetical protein